MDHMRLLMRPRLLDYSRVYSCRKDERNDDCSRGGAGAPDVVREQQSVTMAAVKSSSWVVRLGVLCGLRLNSTDCI
eukprot:9138103-Pyramimonas_sp.AAC.1